MAAIVTRFLDWISLGDYEREKREVSKKIVRRQSRGSVLAQHGFYLSADELKAQSRRADKQLAELREAFKITG